MKVTHLVEPGGILTCSPLSRPHEPGPRQVVTSDPRLVTCQKCQDWGHGPAEHFQLTLINSRVEELEPMGGGWFRRHVLVA